MANHFHSMFSWYKCFFHVCYTNPYINLIRQNLVFKSRKTIVTLSTISYNWFRLTGAMVNQTSSPRLHYGLGYRNMEHGPNLPKGQLIGWCFCHFHESVNDIRLILINRTSCDVNPPISRHIWQNLNTKSIGSYKIIFFFKFHILEFLTTIDEKLLIQK